MEDTLNDASSSAIESSATGQHRPVLEILGLHKRFGSLEVLRDVSLAVSPGEVVVVIGPSGSGKTTLLRCINLLEDYEQGTITIDGEPGLTNDSEEGTGFGAFGCTGVFDEPGKVDDDRLGHTHRRAVGGD